MHKRLSCMLIPLCILLLSTHTALAQQDTPKTSATIEHLLDQAEQELHQTVWKSIGPASRALELAQEQHDRVAAARAHLMLGKIYLDLKDTEKAMYHLMPALNTFVETGNKKLEARTRNRLGRLYRETDDRENALKQLRLAVDLYREVDDKLGLARALNSLGAYYWISDDPKRALTYFNESLALQEALDDKIGQAASHSNIGMVNQKLGNAEQALQHYRKAIEIARSIDYKGAVASALINRATLYYGRKQNRDAWKEAEEAERIAGSIGDLDTSLEAVTLMSNIRRSEGRYQEALTYRDRADEIRDTLAEKMVADRIAELQAQHDLEAKERTIRLLQQENRIQELTIERQRTYRNLMILGIAILLGVGLTFGISTLKKKRKAGNDASRSG